MTTANGGEGSLRQAIIEALSVTEPTTIVLDPEVFAEPRTIALESPLPTITREVAIEGFVPDRLWKASGVTIDGRGRQRVFVVAPGGLLTLRHLTVAGGKARAGGGILNRGRLVLHGVTLLDNEATKRGGGVANRGGIVVLVNTTASGNHARRAGGGLANIGGQARVTNCTFSGNAAAEGASLHSSGELLVSNSILANSEKGDDCVAVRMDPKSGHNLIESGRGCGVPISTADPKLQEIGRYNGPTMTLPLLSGSEAINLGDNDAAVNEHGQPLVWDQRGPGDPRFVAGYTDIGAFEHQRLPVLEVDTVEESPLRGCTAGTVGDCPLRSAIELANEAREPAAITFDPRIFSEPVQLRLSRPLPRVTRELTIDASATPGVSVRCAEGVSIFLETDSEVQLQMFGLTIECPSDGALEAAEHVTNP